MEHTHPECREPPKENVNAHNPEGQAESFDMAEDPTQENH